MTRFRRAATAIEYGILAGLLIIAVLGVLHETGGNLSTVFGRIASAMGVQSSAASGAGNYTGLFFGPNTVVAGGSPTITGAPPIPPGGLDCVNTEADYGSVTSYQNYINATPTQQANYAQSTVACCSSGGVQHECYFTGTSPADSVPYSIADTNFVWLPEPNGSYVLSKRTSITYTDLTKNYGSIDTTKYPIYSLNTYNQGYMNWYVGYNSGFVYPNDPVPNPTVQQFLNVMRFGGMPAAAESTTPYTYSGTTAPTAFASGGASISPGMAELIGLTGSNPVPGIAPPPPSSGFDMEVGGTYGTPPSAPTITSASQISGVIGAPGP